MRGGYFEPEYMGTRSVFRSKRKIPPKVKESVSRRNKWKAHNQWCKRSCECQQEGWVSLNNPKLPRITPNYPLNNPLITPFFTSNDPLGVILWVSAVAYLS